MNRDLAAFLIMTPNAFASSGPLPHISMIALVPLEQKR